MTTTVHLFINFIYIYVTFLTHYLPYKLFMKTENLRHEKIYKY